jgi:ATP adenylyltransferase
MAYIEGNKDQPDGDRQCVFCRALELPADDDDAWVLVRDDLAFVTLAKFPYNPGHLLVLPIRHVGELDELTDGEHAAIARYLTVSTAALRDASAPHGFNLGLNLGRVAGAGIPEHIHWHVVPRWGGDTNFMPVVGQTRVLPEMLADSFAKLRPHFGATA